MVRWKTRTRGHAGQVENGDMRTRNLLKFKKSITRIINNFSRDIESYQGCVITLTFFFSLFSVLVCSSFSVYFASFLVTETNLAMALYFLHVKKLVFAGNYSLQN
jgi:hypothetical protein